ncbi:MAG: hypothetical protein MK198_03720 [Gracilimonas sp.]|uniref:hypothetical protein n=1 Tax=Gracilimonas sp. TaxID=1974203 RepID=UPI0037531D6A|nr:hypothetical protein [Gracilimonas sp.]
MDLSANDVEMIFDDYANYYNDSGSSIKDHISVLAEFSSIGQALELHGKEIDSLLIESFSVLYYAFEYVFNQYLSKGLTREELTKVKIESIVEQLDEIVNKEGRLTSSFIKGEITEKEISNLIDKISYFSNSYIETSGNFDIDTYISTIERELRMLKQVTPHMAAIGLLKRIIINKYYPSQIPIFSELSEDDKAQLRHNGNADKLYIAKDWLHPIIKAISTLEDPTHEMVLEIIQKEFPEFKSIPGEENLSFIKGLNNINKSSIDKALRYLFNEKHDKKIAEGTIRRTFNDYGMW